MRSGRGAAARRAHRAFAHRGQRTLYMGTSVLRGGQAPRVDGPRRRGPGGLVVE